MSVNIMIMGGTISATIVNQGLKKGFSDLPINLKKTFGHIDFSEISMKDSTKINSDDRQLLLKEIENCSNRYIVVTHGTITMMQTAELVKKSLPLLKNTGRKVVCFVGSEFALDAYPTDALLNLGIVLGKVEKMEAGVYCYLNTKMVPI